jgi:porin
LGQFADPRFGTDGVLLASPASNGTPIEHRGDQGVYGVIDQKIMRIGDDAGKGINVFLRASGSPSDRNLIDLYADAGLNFTGLWSARPDDAFGFAVAFSHISDAYRAAEKDVAFYSGLPTGTPSYEAVLEATYSAQIIPGWSVQPDLQYVIHPDGGAANLANPIGLRPLPNALVIGVRSTVKF